MKDKILKRSLAIAILLCGLVLTGGTIALAGMVAKVIVRLFLFGFNLL